MDRCGGLRGLFVSPSPCVSPPPQHQELIGMKWSVASKGINICKSFDLLPLDALGDYLELLPLPEMPPLSLRIKKKQNTKKHKKKKRNKNQLNPKNSQAGECNSQFPRPGPLSVCPTGLPLQVRPWCLRVRLRAGLVLSVRTSKEGIINVASVPG